MKLGVERYLPEMLSNLSPREKTHAAAEVVKMLQQTGEILAQSSASTEVIASFTEDAQAANKIARQTVVEEGFDPELAFQVKLPLKPTT